MRKHRLCKIALVFAMLLSTHIPIQAQTKEAYDPHSATMPNVQKYELGDGSQLSFTQGARLYVVATDKTLNNDALQEDLKLMSSMYAAGGVADESLTITFGPEDKAKPYDIVIKLEDVPALKDKAQSYQIEIQDQVKISAASEVGLFYGMQTVLQMYQLQNGSLYKGTILDYPDSNERSMHLDIARKYFTMDWIKDLLKEMSYMRMNSLQLHFSENEGFRIQSDVLDAKNIVYPNQYYSKAEIAEIVKEAQKYHIDVIPSLDTPGHLRYILNQLPGYSLEGVINDGAASRTFNIFTNPEAKAFLLSLLDEFASFFADLGCTRMNIGGDEFLDNFNKLSNDQYIQVMHYFNEASAVVKQYGMTPRAWNDGLRFGDYDGYTLDQDIEICYWSGGNGCASIEKFVENGHKIMSYVDVYMYYVLASWWDQYANPKADVIYNEWYPGRLSDLHNNGIVSPQRYDEPYPDFLLGASLALWCDTPSYKTEDQIREQIHYRLRVVGEKTWNTHDDMLDYTGFKNKMDALGDTPGTKEPLPSPGEIQQDSEMPSVTLKYEDDAHNMIAPDEIYYGVIDSTYAFQPKAIYGYIFQSASDAMQGSYTGDKVITLTYVLHTNRDALQALLMNHLAKDAYIAQTYQTYDQAYYDASMVYANASATQLQVDEAVKNLQTTQKLCIPSYKQTLYDLVMNAIEQQGMYASASFKAYRAQIEAGKAVLQNASSEEETIRCVALIQASKKNLALGDAVAIRSSEKPYQTYVETNAIDGNKNTFFWTSSDQQIDDYFLFTLREPSFIDTISITQGYHNGITQDIIFGADVLISEDGETWNKVGEIKKENDLEIIVDHLRAKYVKFVITESSKNWIQLNEVQIQATADPNTAEVLIQQAESLHASDYSSYSFEQVQIALQEVKALIEDETEKDALSLAIVHLQTALDLLKAPVDVVIPPKFSTTLQHPWIHTYGNVAFNENTTILHQNDRVQFYGYAQDIAIHGNGQMHIRISKDDERIVDTDSTTLEEDGVLYTNTLDRGYYFFEIENRNEQDLNLTALTFDKGFLEVQEPKAENSVLRDILRNAITKANAMEEQGLWEHTADKVYAYFKNSLHQAVQVLANQNASETDLLTAWQALANSMQYADFVADKTQLNAYIKEMQLIDLSLYKEEGKVAFTEALTYAQDVSTREDVLNETIHKAYRQLFDARHALILISDLNTSILSYLIEKSDIVLANADYYEKDDAWHIFTSVVDEAKQVLKQAQEQITIDQVCAKLANAYEDIRFIANEERLEMIRAFMTRMRSLDISKYAVSDIACIQNAMAYSYALLEEPFTYQQFETFKQWTQQVEALLKQQANKAENASMLTDPLDQTETLASDTAIQSVKTTTQTGDTTKTAGLTIALLLSGCFVYLRKKRS